MADNILKKKILIANTHMEIGGIETALLTLLKNIDLNKYEVDLMIFKMNGELLNKIPEGINVFSFYSSNPFKKTIEKIVLSKNKFGKIMKHILFNYITAGMYVNRKKEYDMAIDFSGYYGFVDKYIMKSKAKRKAIWVHSNIKWNYDNSEKAKNKFNKTKAKYNCFNKIVVVSESSKQEFAKILPEHASKMEHIYNLVNIENILDDKNIEDNISEKCKNALSNMEKSDKYKIVSVGRIVKEKAFDRLIEVHKKLADEGIQVETYLVGSGPLESSLNEKVKEYGLENDFYITGFMSSIDEVTSIVKQADLFVGSSIVEGLSLVVIEALTTGIPIVITNTIGYIDIYKYIAPKGSITLADNSVEGIYIKVKEQIKKKIKGEVVEYNFDTKDFNNMNICKFDELINGGENEKGLISVIIPTYNDSKSIVETLDSLMIQTYKNIECIIVDDGSTDNTKETVEKYIQNADKQKTGIKINYYYQENGDQLNAVQNGLDKINGEFVFVLHSDDLIASENTFERCIQYMNKNKAIDSIIANLDIIDEKSNYTGEQKVRKYIKHKNILTKQLLNLGRNVFVDVNFTRTELYKCSVQKTYITWNMPFWVNIIGERLSQLNVRKVSFPFIKYRIHGGNYINNEIGLLNVVNGELRLATNIMREYDIPKFEIQRKCFRIFDKLGLFSIYMPIYMRRESQNKFKIVETILKWRIKDKYNSYLYTKSVLGFYKNIYNVREINIDLDKEKVYYGKDMRTFNKNMLEGTLSEFYVNFMKDMEQGISKIYVNTELEKIAVIDILKFMCIYGFVEVQIKE